MKKIDLEELKKTLQNEIDRITKSESRYSKLEFFHPIYLDSTNSKNEDKLSFKLDLNELEKKIVVTIYITRKIKLIEKYLEKYLDVLVPFNVHNSNNDETLSQTIGLHKSLMRPEEIVIYADNCDLVGFESRIMELITLCKNKLDEISNIRILDKLANATIDKSEVNPRNRGASGIYYHKMIIAKLAGNPMYEDIYQYYIKMLEDGIKKQKRFEEVGKVHLQIARSLHGDLKDVQPLENPVLI